MGYQQATDTECAYLAGIIDGEGSVGIYGARRKDGTFNFRPRVQIALVHAGGIERISQILRRLGINAHIYVRRAKHPHHTDGWYITVHRFTDLARLLPAVVPYLVIKAPQARMLLDFVNRRFAKGLNRGGNTRLNQYDDDEQGLIRAVRRLNSPAARRWNSRLGVRVLTDHTPAPLVGDEMVEPSAKAEG